jgi:hypothetical protein
MVNVWGHEGSGQSPYLEARPALCHLVQDSRDYSVNSPSGTEKSFIHTSSRREIWWLARLDKKEPWWRPHRLDQGTVHRESIASFALDSRHEAVHDALFADTHSRGACADARLCRGTLRPSQSRSAQC